MSEKMCHGCGAEFLGSFGSVKDAGAVYPMCGECLMGGQRVGGGVTYRGMIMADMSRNQLIAAVLEMLGSAERLRVELDRRTSLLVANPSTSRGRRQR